MQPYLYKENRDNGGQGAMIGREGIAELFLWKGEKGRKFDCLYNRHEVVQV